MTAVRVVSSLEGREDDLVRQLRALEAQLHQAQMLIAGVEMWAGHDDPVRGVAAIRQLVEAWRAQPWAATLPHPVGGPE